MPLVNLNLDLGELPNEPAELYGLATVFPETLANPWLLGTTMLLWIAAPLAIAYARFRH